MAKVEHGNLSIGPNQTKPGDHRNGSFSLGESGSPISDTANKKFNHGDKGMSRPMAPTHGVIKRPDDKFQIASVNPPWPAPVMSPGVGMIPVSPFQDGSNNNSRVLNDSAGTTRRAGGAPMAKGK